MMVDVSGVSIATAKHKKEIEKFAGDGFTDGCLYKNEKGEERLLTWTNYTIGVVGPIVKACSMGDTIICFKGGTCSIPEWYSWLGGKWETVDATVDPDAKPSLVEIAAKARLTSYEKGHVETPKYPVKEGDKKWRSQKTRKPNS